MSSQSITSTIKIFDGTKETFGLWSSRIRSKILAISTNASAALNGRGEFKGVNFKPDMEEEEILVTPGETTGSQLNVFETPCATASNLTSKFKSIETVDTKQKKDGRTKVENDKVTPNMGDRENREKRRLQVQRLYNHLCEKIYHVIIERVNDDVLTKLLNKGLVQGDGVSAYKLLKELYEIGGDARMMTNFLEFINLTETSEGSLTKYTYRFTQLLAHLDLQEAPVPDSLAMCLAINGLQPRHGPLGQSYVG